MSEFKISSNLIVIAETLLVLHNLLDKTSFNDIYIEWLNRIKLFAKSEYHDILIGDYKDVIIGNLTTTGVTYAIDNIKTVIVKLLKITGGFEFIKSDKLLFKIFDEEIVYTDLKHCIACIQATPLDYLYILEKICGEKWYIMYTIFLNQDHADFLFSHILDKKMKEDINIIFINNIGMLLLQSMTINCKNFYLATKLTTDFIAEMQYAIPYLKVYDPCFLNSFVLNMSIKSAVVFNYKSDIDTNQYSHRQILSSEHLFMSMDSKENTDGRIKFEQISDIFTGKLNINSPIQFATLWWYVISVGSLCIYDDKYKNRMFKLLVKKMIHQRENSQKFFTDFVLECFNSDILNVDNIVWLIMKNKVLMRHIFDENKQSLQESNYFSIFELLLSIS